ncbi:MAG: sporulation protein YqfD [Oscillospiraceae bacterium]
MLIIKFLRYILGYVDFTAVGGFPERFINLCTNNKIPLWNLKNSKSIVYGTTTIKGYKAIRQSAKRSGVTLKIEKKHGLPFFEHKNKKRVGLIFGLAFIIILTSFLSTRIWSIDVSGNVKIDKDEILTAFEEVGVRVGASKSSINPKEISDEMVDKMQNLSWAMVNIKGSKALIEISESTIAPEIIDVSEPCNVIASEDGVVTKIHTFSGTPALEIGSAVIKGDLLISGVLKNKNQSERLIHADGKVYATSDKTIISTYNNQSFNKISELNTKYILYFLGIKIPLTFNSRYDNYYKTESFISSKKTTLPIGIIKESSYKTETEEIIDNKTKAKLLSAHTFAMAYKNIESEYKVISGEFSVSDTDKACILSGKYKCEKEIAKKQPIFVEKISD